MFIRTGKGLISAGAPNEKVAIFTPNSHAWDGTSRAAILLSGHNGDAWTPLSLSAYLAGGTALGDLVGTLDAGLPVLTIDASSGQHFGNDTAIARLDEAVDWVASSGLGKAKPILLGTSMGSILAANYAARNPSKVKAVALFYPAMDLQYTHDNGNAAEVETAYGGSLAAFNAAKPTHSPTDQAAALAGVDIKGWYSVGDTVVGPTTWATFKAAHGSAAEESLGAVGHGDNTLIPRNSVSAWVTARR